MEETENVKWCVFKVPQYIKKTTIQNAVDICFVPVVGNVDGFIECSESMLYTSVKKYTIQTAENPRFAAV